MQRNTGRNVNEAPEDKVSSIIRRLLNNDDLKVMDVYSSKFPVHFFTQPSLQTLQAYAATLNSFGISAQVKESYYLTENIYKVPDELSLTDSLENIIRNAADLSNRPRENIRVSTQTPVIVTPQPAAAIRKIKESAAITLKPLSEQDYDDNDKLVIKAMLSFHVARLAAYSEKVSELLRHTAVESFMTGEELQQLVSRTFSGEISDQQVKDLCEDLSMINLYANMTREQLNLQSRVPYAPRDIAKIVHDLMVQLVAENKDIKVENTVRAPASSTITAAMQASGNPVFGDAGQKSNVNNRTMKVETPQV